MKVSRRTILKITGFGSLVVGMMPRVALAARGTLRSLRTGVQPGGKTRLVIETSARPTYTLSYPENQLVISVANTAANASIKPSLASGTLVRSLSQAQSGDRLLITANLTRPIADIAKSQIMILEPNGDNEYRLVLDFMAGSGASSPKTANQTAAQTIAAANTSGAKPIIVIDAGHGGKDPGCIGKNGTREKDVVLSVAKKLRAKLDAAGYKTYMTRTTDEYLKLARRAEIAEQRNADLFLSLHANANPKREMQGFSIYTLSEKASDEEARKLAESENAADRIGVKDFNDFEKDIRAALSSLQQHALAEMSEEYANGCARSFRNGGITAQPGPGVRHAPFAVLKCAVPSALLELGHLSNPTEEKLLKSDSHQNKLVTAIVKSIKNYNFDV